jgi:hypothetical protein
MPKSGASCLWGDYEMKEWPTQAASLSPLHATDFHKPMGYFDFSIKRGNSRQSFLAHIVPCEI